MQGNHVLGMTIEISFAYADKKGPIIHEHPSPPLRLLKHRIVFALLAPPQISNACLSF
ncbi:hypothetical protein [Duganella vulcania]|uniref:hypothetical protein n=1 Tax=Duganella vulcania TaxID=2692166 RepID=UPI0015815ECC|nr:hypothetical protein [Duganella vulcania]